MRKHVLLFLLILLPFISQSQELNKPIVGEDVVFAEIGGTLAVEAEFFYKQSLTETRQWYRTSRDELAAAGRDVDPPHVEGASNGAYLEILPDTRANHGEKLFAGENFSNEPGKLAVTHYRVYINNPGKYYVWVRAYSTGSEDNGLHVGIDGQWPESGQRLQWCEGKNTWRWESKQRTQEAHCGEPYRIYLEIEEAGEHELMFSMREDGFEFDKFVLTREKDPAFGSGAGPEVKLKSGTLPPAFPTVEATAPEVSDAPASYLEKMVKAVPGTQVMKAVDFPVANNDFYVNGEWLAIDPSIAKNASTSMDFPFETGTYDLILVTVGESDGRSGYKISIGDMELYPYVAPFSSKSYEEGPNYNGLWQRKEIEKGESIGVWATTGSKDNQEYSRGRWAGLVFAPVTKGEQVAAVIKGPAPAPQKKRLPAPPLPFSNPMLASPAGDGSVVISGELKQWHKVTLTLNGPWGHELGYKFNPFADYNMTVEFTHESGSPSYQVPGYFAADGNAGETGADAGTMWRAHLSPDKTGRWTYRVSFKKGTYSALDSSGEILEKYSGKTGDFVIGASDKSGRDFRSMGRLEYVGKHHLQFQGSGNYFLKCGADAPETLLAFEDFDATYPTSKNAPLKKYESHVADWKEGYPTWKDGKGKGLIGAVAYLSDAGANSMSFLPYNAGGDGDNVWPFVQREKKMSYDCSKLDQWGIVFDFAQKKGLYLHFKLQENEMDDNLFGHKLEERIVIESLDGGDMGPERKLYCRELVARYGYLLALNWNIGEENTQTTQQIIDMVGYLDKIQPYPHNIVIHTFPDRQEQIYTPLLGDNSRLTGPSLQNPWNAAFEKTLYWRKASSEVGRPWVVCNDEQNPASQGVPPDPGYKGYDAATIAYDIHDIRKQTLYGTLMAGGAGVEYYFGYELPENDLKMEDFRSRHLSWGYGRIAVDFFQAHLPFSEMRNADELIGNTTGDKGKHCLAKADEVYLVYLAYESTSTLDLSGVKGKFTVSWYNPRSGGELQKGSVSKVKGGKVVELGTAPVSDNEDWLVLVRRK